MLDCGNSGTTMRLMLGLLAFAVIAVIGFVMRKRAAAQGGQNQMAYAGAGAGAGAATGGGAAGAFCLVTALTEGVATLTGAGLLADFAAALGATTGLAAA